MKHFISLLLACVFVPVVHSADLGKRAANTVVLDETGVKNLRIETVEVEETEFEEIVFALGRIEAIPNKIAAVSTRVPGRILEMKAITGDLVKAGQEVARLESRQPGDPPPTIVLTAPLTGLVTKVEGRLGAPLEPEKVLMEITDLSQVYAVARVPEHLAGSMKPGTIAHIKVAALPNEESDGELLRFGTSADRQSGTIDAVFSLPNPSGLLRADMRAEFSIVLNKRSGVVSVPRSALQGDASNRFVYVEDFDLPNAFIKSPVVIGEINDRYVEITSGLLPGDKVVTQGAYSLAFAGGGTLSLKEALDAAHGHEHAADGSELKRGEGKGGGHGHAHEGEDHDDDDHDHDHATSGEVWFWRAVSAVLFVLLIASAAMSRRLAGHAREESPGAS